MRNSTYAIHVRFNPNDDDQRTAWNNIHKRSKECCISCNKVIVQAIKGYFENKAMEVRLSDTDKELIHEYAQQIISTVNTTLEKTLPAFIAALLSGKMNELSDIAVDNTDVVQTPQIAEDDIDWEYLGDT
ncbi:MAG: hypothetical protein K5663_10885 [Clostridiales bacterium]|nr:hypothetical protein [Clostridiales bacterium]